MLKREKLFYKALGKKIQVKKVEKSEARDAGKEELKAQRVRMTLVQAWSWKPLSKIILFKMKEWKNLKMLELKTVRSQDDSNAKYGAEKLYVNKISC